MLKSSEWDSDCYRQKGLIILKRQSSILYICMLQLSMLQLSTVQLSLFQLTSCDFSILGCSFSNDVSTSNVQVMARSLLSDTFSCAEM